LRGRGSATRTARSPKGTPQGQPVQVAGHMVDIGVCSVSDVFDP